MDITTNALEYGDTSNEAKNLINITKNALEYGDTNNEAKDLINITTNALEYANTNNVAKDLINITKNAIEYGDTNNEAKDPIEITKKALKYGGKKALDILIIALKGGSFQMLADLFNLFFSNTGLIGKTKVAYRYKVLRVTAKGYFGHVLKVFDHKKQEFTALKMIRNNKMSKKQAGRTPATPVPRRPWTCLSPTSRS